MVVRAGEGERGGKETVRDDIGRVWLRPCEIGLLLQPDKSLLGKKAGTKSFD
jgi:hypothetical protein